MMTKALLYELSIMNLCLFNVSVFVGSFPESDQLGHLSDVLKLISSISTTVSTTNTTTTTTTTSSSKTDTNTKK